LVEEINLSHNGGGQKAICVKADLGELDSPRRIVEAAVDAFGPAIHILVNNAAVSVTKPLADLEVQDYDRVYNVNVRAVVLMTQACLPHLGPDSRVINLSSVGARAAFGGVSLYTSSKAALEGLTRAWAVELGRNGTTVNAVAPGPVQTDMLDTIPVDIVDRQKQDTPVGKRVGLPSEIANVVGWLAGPESGWVSGQVVNASGGWSMY
jgi:3-oxoacyl-[acyl-carrier protein] reductase